MLMGVVKQWGKVSLVNNSWRVGAGPSFSPSVSLWMGCNMHVQNFRRISFVTTFNHLSVLGSRGGHPKETEMETDEVDQSQEDASHPLVALGVGHVLAM